MIQTYVEREHVVQAMRLTGTQSSARSLCRWLSISKWGIVNGTRGTYAVNVPPAMVDEGANTLAVVGDWIVRDKQDHVTIVPNPEFQSRFERV